MTQTELTIVHPSTEKYEMKKRKREDEEQPQDQFTTTVRVIENKRSKRDHLDVWKSLKEEKGTNRTPGVIKGMEPNFYKGKKVSIAVTTYLCSPSTDHITSDKMDLGWGCGYRNCQMLMSFLERHEENGDAVLKQVPDVRSIQVMLENAWKEGFDPEGAKDFGQSVAESNKWIGTTEVYSLLAYLGVRSSIIDFHQPDNSKKKLHTKMMDWIESYFTSDVKRVENEKNVYITDKPPLYLQHQGHSRTVVGIEVLHTGKKNLIMFDPGQRSHRTTVGGKENMRSNATIHPSLLCPRRVDEKMISKNKQYQVLALGHIQEDDKFCWNPGYLLDEKERNAKKSITSLVVL
ncbi:DUF1671-domain-containing protein [Backusella circina FSU 941]|nr:DUF1671-domain-containing protein [Backusella circina FSU 941]